MRLARALLLSTWTASLGALACGGDDVAPSAPDAGDEAPDPDADIEADAISPADCVERLTTGVAGRRVRVEGVTLDATHIYWVEVWFEESGATQSIWRLLKAGGEPERVANDVSGSSGLDFAAENFLAADGRIYWGGTGLYRVPVGGGEIETLVSDDGRIRSLVADGGFLYWIEATLGLEPDPPDPVVRRMELATSQIETIALTGEEVSFPHRLTVADGEIYWATWLDLDHSTILRSPAAGGEGLVIDDLDGDFAVNMRIHAAVSPADLFYTTYGASLHRVNLRERQTLVDYAEVPSPMGPSIEFDDDSHVIWNAPEGGAIERSTVTGEGRETLIGPTGEALEADGGFAVEGQELYVGSDGELLKIRFGDCSAGSPR